MTTFKRICIKNYQISDDDDNVLTLIQGQEYLTSADKGGEVCVFTRYWVYVPADIFAGAEQFTGPETGD